MKIVRALLTLSICATAIVGDYVVFKSKYSESQVFRAFADNLVHASIGLLSSLAFFVDEIRISSNAMLYNVIICTIVSSLIDIDHLFEVKSFRWKDLFHFKQRGIFHCTTFWIILTSILLGYSHVTKQSNIYILTWMLILAYTSHHIRDSNRRGLWFYPFGHTPALNKFLYVFLVAILPHAFCFIYRYSVPSIYKHSVIEYSHIINIY